MHQRLRLQALLIIVVFSIGIRLSSADVWNSPAFTTDPAILRQAAQAVQAEKTYGSHRTVERTAFSSSRNTAR
jgi:hypothetical protein